MARRRVNTTKMEIIQVASRMFLDEGFTKTSAKAICDELDISTGNLTFYFSTKEHMLAALVEMLCDFQWKMMEEEVDEGNSSLMAVCLEFTAMAAMCEDNEIAKDFYLSAYSSPLTLEIIRKNDVKRARMVFKDYCSDWSDENFVEAETLVSGIEYATLMTTGDSAALDVRIAGALNNILMIYNVPEQVRKAKIEKVFSMDYHRIGKRVLTEFKKFVEETNDKALEQLMRI